MWVATMEGTSVCMYFCIISSRNRLMLRLLKQAGWEVIHLVRNMPAGVSWGTSSRVAIVYIHHAAVYGSHANT